MPPADCLHRQRRGGPSWAPALRPGHLSGPVARGVLRLQEAHGACSGMTRVRWGALGPPAADPLVGRDARDAHLCCDVRDRSARVDTLYEQLPAVNGQPGITVGHEDLRAVQS
jgi:hypothetical protein